MNATTSFLRSLGAARLAAMVLVAAVLVGFFAFLITRFTGEPMAPLYGDLTMEDSSAIVKVLETSNVPYELKYDGGTILVPETQVLKLRMKLAEAGIPSGGSVGYEIFDKTNALGTTSFVQNINHIRALEGELTRTIRTIDRITSARVHLVIPERQLFQKDARQPTASIVLKVRGNLEQGQIRAIQHLVASAVDGLRPGNVSIVDEAGRLLASGEGDDGTAALAASMDERTANYEKRLRNQLEEIVGSVVGPGRARVQVNAELDFNRTSETQDSFDPESQVVRSSQSRNEKSENRTNSGEVTVGNQLPGGANASSNDGGGEKSETSEETLNYEISRTTKTQTLEAGSLKRISVAVLVDGIYTKDASGEYVYAPRAQDELDRITALVRAAVGFDKTRGDQVQVENLRLAEAPRFDELDTSPDGILSLTKDDYFYAAEVGLAGILGILVIFFVLRPLIRRIVTPEEGAIDQITAASAPLAIAGPAPVPARADGRAMPDFTDEISNETALQIERAKQTGALHADTIKKVGTLIEDSPQEAVSIVRTWLSDAA